MQSNLTITQWCRYCFVHVNDWAGQLLKQCSKVVNINESTKPTKLHFALCMLCCAKLATGSCCATTAVMLSISCVSIRQEESNIWRQFREVSWLAFPEACNQTIIQWCWHSDGLHAFVKWVSYSMKLCTPHGRCKPFSEFNKLIALAIT